METENINYLPHEEVGVVSGTPQKQTNFRYLIVGLVLVAVTILSIIGFELFQLRQQPTAVTNIQETPGAAVIPATNVAHAVSPLFQPSSDPNNVSLADLEDPFFHEPCFFSATQTCLTQMMFPPNSTNLIDIRAGILPQKQLIPDTFFMSSRMMVIPSPIRRFYQSSHLDATSLDAVYFVFARSLITAGLANNINPGLLYAVYDAAYDAAQTQGVSVNDQDVPDLDPMLLSQQLSVAQQKMVDPGSDVLAKKIKDLGWTKAGGAVLYVAVQNLNPQVIPTMFASPHGLELSYQSYFSPEKAEGSLNVVESSGNVTLSGYTDSANLPSAESSQINPSYFIAVCLRGSAALCERSENTLSCHPAGFLQDLCGTFLPNR